MNCIDNFGLEFLLENDTRQGFLNRIFSEGETLRSYYHCPYVNMHCGALQFIAKTTIEEEKKIIHFAGLDTHMVGTCVWEMVIQHVLKNDNENDVLAKKLMVSKKDERSFTVVNLVNAEVLPSFLPGELIKAQMIAFAMDVHYHKDEASYEATQQNEDESQSVMIAEGAVIPVGFLNEDNPDYIMIKGTVKKAICKSAKFGDDNLYPCISTFIDTQYGELEIVHTNEQINESERAFIKEGCIIEGLVVLSADVAIYEYDKGIVFNEKNNLALMRYTIQEGDAERLRVALSENAVYISDTTQKTYYGADQIIQRFHKLKDNKFFAYYATITQIDDGEEPLPYEVGQTCLILAMHTEDNLDAICFMEYDKQGKISKIYTTDNPRYHFKIHE